MRSQSCRTKILFLDQTLNGGGAERVLCTVIRGLDSDKYEIHLVIITKLGALAHLVPDYVHIHILGIPHTRKALFTAIRALWKIRPDIVYTTTVRTALLVSCSSFLSPKFTFIMRFPTMPIRLVHTSPFWHLRVMRFFYRRADYVIAQTKEMAEELAYYFDITKKNIKIISNPLDYDQIEKCTATAKNPFDKEKINIVASGNIHPVKGHDILIKAFAEVITNKKKFNLFILGKDQGGNTERLQSLCSALNINEYVHFLGFIQNPYPYYKFCDLFVLSSRVEGCPNVLLEAIYLERPAVATRCVAVVSRIIEEGKTGFLVEPDNIDQLRDAIIAYQKLTPKKSKRLSNGIVQFIEKITDKDGRYSQYNNQ